MAQSNTNKINPNEVVWDKIDSSKVKWDSTPQINPNEVTWDEKPNLALVQGKAEKPFLQKLGDMFDTIRNAGAPDEPVIPKGNDRKQLYAGEAQFAVPDVITTPQTGGVGKVRQPSITEQSPEVVQKRQNMQKFLDLSDATVKGLFDTPTRNIYKGAKTAVKGFGQIGEGIVKGNASQAARGAVDVTLGGASTVFSALPPMYLANMGIGATSPLTEAMGEKVGGEAGKEIAKRITGIAGVLPFGKVMALASIASQAGEEGVKYAIKDWKIPEEDKNRILALTGHLGFFGTLIAGNAIAQSREVSATPEPPKTKTSLPMTVEDRTQIAELDKRFENIQEKAPSQSIPILDNTTPQAPESSHLIDEKGKVIPMKDVRDATGAVRGAQAPLTESGRALFPLEKPIEPTDVLPATKQIQPEESWKPEVTPKADIDENIRTAMSSGEPIKVEPKEPVTLNTLVDKINKHEPNQTFTNAEQKFYEDNTQAVDDALAKEKLPEFTGTTQAEEFGLKNPDRIAELESRSAESDKKAKELGTAGDWTNSMIEAQRGSLAREAIRAIQRPDQKTTSQKLTEELAQKKVDREAKVQSTGTLEQGAGIYGERSGMNQVASTYTTPDGTVLRRYPSRKIGNVVIPEGWGIDNGANFKPPAGSLKPTVEEATANIKQGAAKENQTELRSQIATIEKPAPLDADKNDLTDLDGVPMGTNPDGTITLYHRTTPESAKEMMSTGVFKSKENTNETFFSNKKEGQAEGYGNTIVAVKVKPNDVRLNDAFHNGEIHVAVSNKKLSKKSILQEPVAKSITPADKNVSATPIQTEVRKIKDFKTDEGNFSTYDIAKDVRGRADMFTVLKDKNGYIVRNALIPEEMRRSGIASKFYEQMNEESIKKTGNPLRSTQPRKLTSGETVHELSNDAVGLWDNFVKRGLAKKLGDKNYEFKPPIPESGNVIQKEPWQMTKDEYVQSIGGEIGADRKYPSHKKDVVEAIKQGKSVPPEVLKDYPDLNQKVGNSPKVTEEPIQGKETAKQRMDKAKAENVLNTKVNYTGTKGIIGVMTRREFLDKSAEQGAKAVENKVTDTAAIKRLETERDALINSGEPSGNPNWPRTKRYREIVEQLKTKPTKTQYNVEFSDGSLNTVGKMEYDYLKSKQSQPSPTKGKGGTLFSIASIAASQGVDYLPGVDDDTKKKLKILLGVAGFAGVLGMVKGLSPEGSELFKEIEATAKKAGWGVSKGISEFLKSDESKSLKPEDRPILEKLANNDKTNVIADRLDKISETVKPQETSKETETVGIRQESLEKRFEGKIQAGKGASTADLVKQGQELYKSGKADAEAIGTKVRAGEGINAQEMGVLRAKASDLAKQSNDAQDLANKNSQLQETADKSFNDETKWIEENLKPAETEWSKMGMAMQGETDIDTGTLTGLRRAVQEQHGRDLKPVEVEKAKELATEVTGLNKQIDVLQKGIQKDIQRLAPKGKTKLSPELQKAKDIWTHAKANYIDKGIDFETMLRGTSQDLGITQAEVTKALIEPKSTRIATREMLRLMSLRRQAISNAKSWVKGVNTPKYMHLIQTILRVPFSIATLGHAVVQVTHAGQHIFMPSTWNTYWKNVGNQFHYWGSRSYHEQMMQELEQHPRFYYWKKAGLAIDPNQVYDPYQAYSKWLGKLGEPGRRSMDAVKTFRIADAESIWDKTPQSLKTGDYAKEVASLVNHQSGLGKIGSGNLAEGANVLMFAARLEASRWARIIGDPIKAATTLARGSKATPEEHASAILSVKRSAEFVGVYMASLVANQALNSVLGSKSNVNFTDPKKSDFLRFKIGGLAVDPTGSMTTPVRFLANIISTSLGEVPKRGGRFNTIVDVAGHYARGKLSPAAGIIADVGVRSDFTGKPLPNASQQEKNKRQPYSWTEYFLEQHGPIAISGAVKEVADVWRSQGMSNAQIQQYLKALAILAFESTGIRAGNEPKPKSGGQGVVDPMNMLPKERKSE